MGLLKVKLKPIYERCCKNKPHTSLHDIAMVDKLDESVGIIVKELGMRKLLNNSIVIFASDNGGAPEGNRITFYIFEKILKTIAYLYQNVHTSHLH